MIVKLNVAVTKKCNLRCKHCNIWKLYLENPELEKFELTEDEVIKVFENTPGAYWASFTGGETFLKDVGYILENLPSKTRFVSVNTNGFFTEKIVRTMESVPNNRKYVVVISLDGPRDVHDDIRGVKGSFDRAVGTFIKLRDEVYGVEPVFEFTITPWNIGVFDDLLKELSPFGIGVENFTFSLYTPNVYYNKTDGGNSHVNDVVKEALRISKMISIKRPVNAYVKSFLKLSEIYYTKKERHPCLAGRRSAWIEADGGVRTCIYIPKVFGNVREHDYNVEKVLKGSGFEKYVKACRGCWTPCESFFTMTFKPWVMVRGLVRKERVSEE